MTYADYAPKTLRCSDCERYVYEQLLAGVVPTWAIRHARIKRTEGTRVELLCHAHANERRALDRKG